VISRANDGAGTIGTGPGLVDSRGWRIQVVSKLGFEQLRRHDLRHTGLTWLADAGVLVHVLQSIAGHGSITTTQRYLHPDRRAIEEAGTLLNSYVTRPRSPGGPQPIMPVDE
jgi:integrase